jgi:hypothetical protein
MNPIINSAVMRPVKEIPRFCIADDSDDGDAVTVDEE